ncbi:MAG: MBOAT family protein [Oscillospiraceae bacterium]|nr:MBOAT family protein [Oscillospiraceae bacterium]
MVFSQLAFLYFFLPVTLLLYYGAGKDIRAKNMIILLSGLIFYAWGEPFFVAVMLLSTMIDYTAGRFMDKYDDDPKKRKTCLIVSVCMNVFMLTVFKYSDFIFDSVNSLLHTSLVNPALLVNRGLNRIAPFGLDEKRVKLPIGISFYTFQSMSYTIDLYRRNIKVQKDPLKFAAYVTLFPQIVAGPIVRYSRVAAELESREITAEKVSDGVSLFVRGLAKKVLLANNIGMLWTEVKASDFTQMSSLTAWLGILAFTFQIYFDFSGYSDMASGMGKMLGFEFPKNFDHPYMSKSVSEFWRRWHITLGEWFKNYVYFPLGGSRCGTWKTVRNLMIVWALTGLWHGASWNFVLWGIYFGVLIVAERLFFGKILEKLPDVVRVLYTFLMAVLGWVLFDTDSITDAALYLKSMFAVPSVDDAALYAVSGYLPLFLICAVVSSGILSKCITAAGKLLSKAEGKLAGGRRCALIIGRSLAVTAAEAAVFLLCTVYVIGDVYNPFLYFRF